MAETKSVLMIIPPDQFRDEELFEPQGILERRGVRVTIASTRRGKAYGMMGGSYEMSTLVSDVTGSDFDAVVVVGGVGSPEFLWDDAHVHRVLHEARTGEKVIAGICLSGACLAKAEVLVGKRATVFATPESIRALKENGAHYVKRDLVEDGNVITAEGPHAAVAFGESLVRALGLDK